MIYEKPKPLSAICTAGVYLYIRHLCLQSFEVRTQTAPRHISGGLKGNIFEQGTG